VWAKQFVDAISARRVVKWDIAGERLVTDAFTVGSAAH